MKTWIVGVDEGSIGETLQSRLATFTDDTIIGSTIQDVDVREWANIDLWLERFGPFDNVVYAVGANLLNPIHSVRKEHLEDITDVNLFGFIGMMQSLVTSQSTANVVAIISDAARIPMRNSIAYCCSKAAIEMAVRVAARELAPHFRVNGVRPGPVAGTGMTKQMEEDLLRVRGWEPYEIDQQVRASLPIGRWIDKAEVCAAITHVLNGPAAQTGSIVDVTGGR